MIVFLLTLNTYLMCLPILQWNLYIEISKWNQFKIYFFNSSFFSFARSLLRLRSTSATAPVSIHSSPSSIQSPALMAVEAAATAAAEKQPNSSFKRYKVQAMAATSYLFAEGVPLLPFLPPSYVLTFRISSNEWKSIIVSASKVF